MWDLKEKMGIKAKEVMTVPDGTYTIGDGLILKVRNNGSTRSWIFRYSISGKRKDYSIAPAKKMNLATAKAEAIRLQALVVSGIDIQAEKQKKKAQPKEVEEQMHPFDDFAREAYEQIKNLRGNLARETLRTHQIFLNRYCVTAFGKKPIEKVTTEDVVGFLLPIWTSKTATAKNVRALLDAIFSYAINRKIITRNPARWQGNLEFYLPAVSTIHRTEHHKAIDRYELKGRFRAQFNKSNRITALTIFTILTASRINETIGARWDELDFEKKIWTCPRVKDRKREEPHRVPLSEQAIELLKRMPRGASPFVFTMDVSDKSRKADGSSVLKRFRQDFETDATIHGCRSTFRDWCAEEGKSFEAAEIQMQHKIGTAVTRSYFRSDLLEQRRVLMQEWADFLLPRNPQKEDST